jgi:hypothetical protein
VLAALAAAMRLAVRCAASLSRLGAAQVLAPPAASVRLAMPRVASSGLGAALVLAAPAAAVRLAVRCAACLSCLEAALLLAPFASAMRDAGARGY